MEIPRIYSESFLEKEFIELIFMNPLIVLYLVIDHVDSCRSKSSLDLRHQRYLCERLNMF